MRKLAMWGSGVIALFLLQHISVAISQQQSQGTCAALQRIISGRRIQDTGDCSANVECTGFTCSGVVNSDSDSPVTNNSTYTFHPCDDPVRFTIFGEVSSLEFPIINASVAKGTSVPFTPASFGTLHITLIPIQNGIRFGVSIRTIDTESNTGHVVRCLLCGLLDIFICACA